MTIIVLTLFTSVTVLGGWLLLKSWFNHLSIYSLIWGSVLIFAESGLISYHSISELAWVYILGAWVCLFLGSATVFWIRGRDADGAPMVFLSSWALKLTIWTLSLIGLTAVLQQFYSLIGHFDGLSGILVIRANALYATRLNDESFAGGATYANAFSFAACSLAGVYTAKQGRVTLTGVIPLLLVTLSGVMLMARAGMIFAGIWFAAAFVHTPRPRFKVRKWQRAVGAAVGIGVLAAGFTLISTTRGLGVDYPGLSPSMERASDVIPILPSLFFYTTGPVVGFSDYINHPDPSKSSFWGMYTFAPVFRLLARLGLPTMVPYYDEFHYTPAPINVMTYLKNVHSDFGGVGVFVFPFVLGGLMTWLRLRLDGGFRIMHLIILAHCYVIIIFSSFINVMLQGVWYISLILGTAVAYWLDRSEAKHQLQEELIGA